MPLENEMSQMVFGTCGKGSWLHKSIRLLLLLLNEKEEEKNTRTYRMPNLIFYFFYPISFCLISLSFFPTFMAHWNYRARSLIFFYGTDENQMKWIEWEKRKEKLRVGCNTFLDFSRLQHVSVCLSPLLISKFDIDDG